MGLIESSNLQTSTASTDLKLSKMNSKNADFKIKRTNRFVYFFDKI